MFSALLAAAIVVWFALLCPFVLRHLTRVMTALDAPIHGPLLLMIVFSFLPLVFNVPREDGTAVLEEGLSSSNLLTVFLTGVAALYLVFRAAADRRLLFVAFARPYLAITLLLACDAASTLWSIVPAYTLYRTAEVAVFSMTAILIFDRSDIERRLGGLLCLIVLAWLVAVIPDMAASFAQGIVFSAAKNNMMPLVCAALILLAAFQPSTPRRGASAALGCAGFVIAGSAASTGALLAAIGPAMLIASRRPVLQVLGSLLAVASVIAFVVLMLGLSNFPVLLDLASTILQKPAVELSNATGRDTFWPTFIAATRDHVFGSGFSAADRFVQLLIPTGDLAEEIGQTTIHYSSAHNMFLSAWAGTGVMGLGFCALVLGSAVQWGLKLDTGGRRFVVALVLMLILNGMTTPGIFQDWTANNLAFVAVLAYARVGALQRRGTGRVAVRGSPMGGRDHARRPAPHLAG